jgi:hypothetical protein
MIDRREFLAGMAVAIIPLPQAEPPHFAHLRRLLQVLENAGVRHHPAFAKTVAMLEEGLRQ